jgi:hypothetical protein
MDQHDTPALLDEYLRLLHLLAEVRERFPSDDSPEVLAVTRRIEKLEMRIREGSRPDTDS